MSKPLAPTERFGDRVEDYRRYRPGYPPELVPWLMLHCGLGAGDAVADIGSGTGLFARELLAAGLAVHGVEPNAPMRQAGEAFLAAYPGFTSHGGSAEATGLAPASVRLVTAAQAFHWFDAAGCRREFARILVPGGHVALIWNLRAGDTPFLVAYEALLRQHAPEYARSGRPAQADEPAVRAFFAPQPFVRRDFAYRQRFDRAGLRGRLLSSSYAPAPGTPGHMPMIAALDALFDAYQQDGQVSFSYCTRVFVGTL